VIAESLGTAEATVKIHRGRVIKKMAAASSAGLVRMAEALKALPPNPPAGPARFAALDAGTTKVVRPPHAVARIRATDSRLSVCGRAGLTKVV